MAVVSARLPVVMTTERVEPAAVGARDCRSQQSGRHRDGDEPRGGSQTFPTYLSQV